MYDVEKLSDLRLFFCLFVYPVCLVNGVPWPQEPGRRNSHTFNCRMLKRPPDEVDSENPEARQQYEIMQCFTVSQPRSVQEEGEGACNAHVCTPFHSFSFLLFTFGILNSTLTKNVFGKCPLHVISKMHLKVFGRHHFQNLFGNILVSRISQTYLDMILANLVCRKLN